MLKKLTPHPNSLLDPLALAPTPTPSLSWIVGGSTGSSQLSPGRVSATLHSSQNPPHKGGETAFTLAEVLITLGIIGIVAALTIPTLNTNLQHKIATARLKNFYSTMKQMILLSTEDNGDVNTWDITLPYDEFLDKYFLPYLKGTRTISGDKNRIYFLDGSSIVLFKGDCMDIYYDYNSSSLPNKRGYDQFSFLICSNDVKQWCGDVGFCGYRRNAIKNNRTKMLEKCQQNPNYCSGLLEYDHWEFLPDYPYK